MGMKPPGRGVMVAEGAADVSHQPFSWANVHESRKACRGNAGARPMAANGWSKTWTFYEGDWHEGNIGIVGPRTHAMGLRPSGVDGARAFGGGEPGPFFFWA